MSLPDAQSTDSKSMEGYETVTVQRWQQGHLEKLTDRIAEEHAVALVYNGISHVVMMASPQDLDDFALGFSLTEGIVEKAEEFYGVEVERHPQGYELQVSIASQRMNELTQRRRNLAGRTGCGLCGAESLNQAIRSTAKVTSSPIPASEALQRAVTELTNWQPMQALTGAFHGAAWCNLQGDIVLLREDVGRHNALDKLIGALCRKKVNFSQGFALVSSRASYEMVQKTTSVGITTLAAVSAPTSLAVQLAEEAGLNLIGFARTGRHVIYTTLR
ncbi:formate dehydrogenase accessory sulfurtransferase FdhD [Motiliproteus sp. MSK22-1]|uniref:formate dehydrogenase accessory sulfurtransferase FdhD n=1 Tax=Motiliproteus sp. MSK22-1 TaxID=1897630 RepID=UPI0009F98FE0|nr:formate dehydrogenase accessory sulfurtransferase FdhD [Motiliproteus sp. MSK22-1]